VNGATTAATLSENYVRQLRVHNRTTLSVYRCILNGFQRFATERASNRSISHETIREWLNDRILVWPFHLVAHRARLVERFLNWRVKNGTLGSNPLEELKEQYGQRMTTPLVRALLSPDFEAALEALRPAPRFGSFLGPVMREHVEFMKAIGYRYNAQERRLLRLDRFLQGRPDLSGQPLTVLIREWTNTGCTQQHRLECHQTGRSLSRALLRVDPTTENIPWDKRIEREARQLYRRPYIFSDQEISSLLQMALKLSPSFQSPLRPRIVHMMLVLGYCAGLRIGEIVRLNVGDVDLADRAIDILETKFFKSRRLPLSDSVAGALQSYLDARKQAGAPTNSSTPLFWHRKGEGRYSQGVARQLMMRVFRLSGIKMSAGRTGPRIHDLRHAFVFNRMLEWYREGINPQARLPYLATYLGHKDIKSTLVYLTITQELLQHAGERFREFGAGAVSTAMGGKQ
jgi:integrase/recombinase XerD